MMLRGLSTSDFRALYAQHYGFVWAILRRLGVEGAATDDAVQDTFLTAYRRRADFHGTSAKPWLYGIARRVASNYRRSAIRGRRRLRALTSTRGSDDLAAAARRVEGMVELERVLGSLSRDDRELFFLSEVDGLSGPELASALRMNQNTVYWRVRKLRDRLSAVAGDRGAALVALRSGRPQAEPRAWAALLTLLEAPKATLAIPWLVALSGVSLAAGAFLSWPNREVATPRSEPTEAQVSTAADMKTATSPVIPSSEERAAAEAPSPPPRSPSATSEPHRPPRRLRSPEAKAPADTPPPGSTLPTDAVRVWTERLQLALAAVGRGDPRTALTLTEAPSPPPSIPLDDLRLALRIEALCNLDRADLARATAREFFDRRPRTVMRGRIEQTCVGTPRIHGIPNN